MPFVTAPDGVRLHYDVEGVGPPLVLHLGAGCDSDLWRAAGYVEPLSHQYQCILFDHRGHGQSDNPKDVSAHHIDRYVDDVIALLDHMELESSHFWGWSNGLMVGAATARRHPARIRSLILGGPVGKPVDPETLKANVERRVADLQREGWDLLINAFASEEGACPAWMAERIRATDIGQLICYQRARLEWTVTPWDLVVQCPRPALVILGDLEDEEHLMTEACAAMQDATEVRLEGLGHIKAFLASDRMLPHVEAFLARQSRIPAVD